MSVLSLTLTVATAAYAHGSDPAVPWLRIALAFLFCVGVAVAAILWLRARQGSPIALHAFARRIAAPHRAGAPRELEVEERLRISPTAQVLVLRCGARRYLVHVGPQGAQTIDRLDEHGDETGGAAP